MSFGLCNAPGTYARVMNLVLRGLTSNTVLAFLDDILVLGSDFQSHLTNLKHVFERFTIMKGLAHRTNLTPPLLLLIFYQLKLTLII
jgi:hypothetical protein